VIGEAPWPALDTLGEDLILLSPRDRKGSINMPVDLDYGLTGAELVRLVAGGHVEIVKGRIARLDVPPPADANLAAALESIFGDPKWIRWIGKRRKGIEDLYKRELESKGVLRSEHRKWLGLIPTTSWFVVDEQRSVEVR
jgi:hypothetical protein